MKQYVFILFAIIFLMEATPVHAAQQTHEDAFNQRSIAMSHVQEAWDQGLTGKGVKVAIIDTGVDPRHPDLNADKLHVINCTLSQAKCITMVDKPNTDVNSHGTHVTGILAAQHNGVGMKGIAPDVEIFSLKIGLANEYRKGQKDFQKALEWILAYNEKQDDPNERIRIVNMSISGNMDAEKSDLLHRIHESGTVLIAAAGNNGSIDPTTNWDHRSVAFPARHRNVIAVGAVNGYEKRAGFTITTEEGKFSATGPQVDIAAPGRYIYSTVPTNTVKNGVHQLYAYKSGTSMATPFISGMTALYMQAYPHESAEEIETRLLTNTKYIEGYTEKGHNWEYGNGIARMNTEPTFTAYTH